MKLIKLLLAGLTLTMMGIAPAVAAEKPLVIQSGKIKQLPSATTLQLQAPTTANATVNLPHGTAPTSPTNGDCWTTATGLFCRISGATVGPYGTASAGSPEVLIEEWIADGTTGSKTFASIPGTYRSLRLIWFARGSAASTIVNMSMTFNGDTAANYDREIVSGNSASTTAAADVASTSVVLGTISAATSPSGEAGNGQLLIPGYANTTFRKSAHTTQSFKSADSAAGLFIRSSGIWWRSTAAISSMEISLASGNFVSGSRLVLYGVP